MSRLKAVAALGQQIWLDNLTRDLVQSGRLARWIKEDAIAGVTSNPAIFYNAIKNDAGYQADLAELKARVEDREARFEALALPDVQAACDLLRPVYEARGGKGGYVSFEVSPRLAGDVAGTVAAAQRLWQAIDRPNAMIKIPATPAGIEALADVLAAGINVNVTLIFSLGQLSRVQAAHRAGLSRRLAQGLPVQGIASVASIFVSRTDTLLDPRLPAELQGKTAISLCKIAYANWIEARRTEFSSLARAGAEPQWLLWASTSAKNPAYRDVVYVEQLIGADTVNTVPDATLEAFRDHGEVAPNLDDLWSEAAGVLGKVTALGINLEEVGEELQAAGLRQFEEAYDKLLDLVS